jgi:hypothetical protein
MDLTTHSFIQLRWAALTTTKKNNKETNKLIINQDVLLRTPITVFKMKNKR